MKNRKIGESFRDAADGILYVWRTQRNMRVHFLIGFLVLLTAWFLEVNRHDWLILFFAISLVFITEMINTAVEKTVDLFIKTYHPLARIAKNVAAGAVLVAAINSVLVGLLVFGGIIIEW